MRAAIDIRKDHSRGRLSDAATDIAILKVDGNDFSALALAASSAVKTGDKICTIGYPNIRMQGQEAKYTEGVISSLSGPGNNPRYFQISTAVQQGKDFSVEF